MAEEVGVGYVRLVPSMRGFAKAATRELKSALEGPARRAGEDAGDEAAKGGKPAGGKFAKGFGAGLKDGLRGIGDRLHALTPAAGQAGGEAGEGFAAGLRRTLGAKASGIGQHFAASFSDKTEKGIRARLTSGAGGLLRAFGKELSITAKPTAVTAATAFSSQFIAAVAAGLASGIGKVAHGLGAIAALVPAAVATGVLAFGTLKVAVLGVGDALEAGLSGDTEAFNEALKALSPSARSFARSIAGMKDELDDLKSLVQENFFSQFSDKTKKLGSTYLPVLKSAMGGVATSFGTAVREAAGFLTLPKTTGAVSMALGHMGGAIDNVARAIQPMIRAFLPLIEVGSTFLPKLTGGLASAANQFADFMEHARDTGKLARFIQGGLDKLRSLWETTKQVGRIFEDITGIGNKLFAGATLSGGHLLDTIERGVDRLNRFFETAKGAALLAQILDAGRAVLGTLMGTLQRLGGILGRTFGPILPQILDFVEAFANLKSAVLDTALDALEPILAGLGAVLGSVVLPALTGLANWLTENQPVLQGIGIAIMALLVPAFVAWAISAGIAAINTLLLFAPLILIGAAIAALAALFIIHWDTIKKATAAVAGFVRDKWDAAWKAITSAVGAVVGFIGDHWRGLVQILTGPIGLAVAVIANHWNTIRDAIDAVLGWIGDHWALLLAALSLPLAVFAALVVTQWEHIRAFIATVLGAIATVVTTVFTAIATVVTAVFGFMAAVITTVFTTIAAVAAVVFNAIAAVASTTFGVIAALAGALGGFVMGVWRAIASAAVAAWQWIWNKTASVRDAIGGAVSWLQGHIVGVFWSVYDGVAGAWSAIQNAIAAVVDWIAGKVEAVMGMIGDIGNAISSIPGAGVVSDIIGAFDVGGMVPGPKGAPALAIVHGGETIVPTHDPGAMRNFATDQFTDAQHASISTTRAVAPAPSRLIIDVTGGPPEMVRLIKKMVRTEGHGDPVAYLSP